MRIGGLLLCFAGMALLCGLDAVAKALGAHLGAFQIAFVRYAGAALWLALYIVVMRSAWPNPRYWRRHLLRAVLAVATASFFFYGVTRLPLAIATALAMTAPVYVSLLGIVFLKERPSPALALAIALGVGGSLVVVFGDALGGGGFGGGGAGDISGWIAGLLAPVTYAASIVLLKRHADDEGAAALTLGTAVIASLVLLPVAVPGFALPPPSAWLLLLPAAGLLGALGFILLTTGLRTTPALTFAIVDYTSLLWAALFGFMFFAEVPELKFWIGGGLIVVACVVVMRTTKREVGSPVAEVAMEGDGR